MAPNRIAVAKFAVKRAESDFGWNKAAFSRELFGDERRQVINGWLKRGLPADQDLNVATKLGLTVEQLLAAGAVEVPDRPLPSEAADFAREWLQLPPMMRGQIRTMVIGMLELGRDNGGAKGAKTVDRPILQRRRGT